jgi:hypothetical protein
MTEEKWFASGESKIFRISRNEINVYILLIFMSFDLVSEKDFETRRSHFSSVTANAE